MYQNNKQRLPTRVVVALVFTWALASCQGPQYNIDRMSAVQGGDATLVMRGCEGDLARGYQVCRFVDGAPLKGEHITMVIPFGDQSLASNIRVRSGAKAIMLQNTGPSIKLDYSDIFEGSEFTKENDGPIQIIVKTLNKDGSFYETLGYVFVIVLNKGYSKEPTKTITKCKVQYTDMGESQVDCD